MSKSFSLERLSRYLTEVVDKISAVRKEVEEIQVGFNSAYVEWRAEHDVTLGRLTEALADKLDEVGPGLAELVQERLVDERRIADERRQELRDKLIPETQAEADEALDDGGRLTKKLRQLNPRLDEREEKLKAQRADLEGELVRLNDQIRDLSGCLGVVIHFPKISRLDRQRQQVIGKLETVQEELREVRQEWQTYQGQIGADQEALQTTWQEATLKLAQLQAELAYLDDEVSREALARRRAVRNVVDHLKEPIPCSVESLQGELDSMVELNVLTDDYQAGLGSVGSFMSVLDGIIEGLRRFNESVDGLSKEQRMHSSYLPKLDVSVPDEVLVFHEQWDGLRNKVRDEGHHCARPAEFVALVQPVMENGLGEANIQGMFEGLGDALSHATKRWRG
jgi:chromosome segregation ATPase